MVFHPCRNREVFIDLNGIEKKLCESGNYDAGSLLNEYNNALGSGISLSQIENYENIFSTLGINDLGDKLKFISGNPCNDEQWVMPPIDWETSSCDQIFAQLLKAMQGQHLFVNCFGGKSGGFNLSRYFTNMNSSKTCGESTFTTSSGAKIKGSFDLNFTLSGNPQHLAYLANGYVQNQGIVSGSGKPMESYIMFGPNSNAPLIHFGITQETDNLFISFIQRPCPPK